MDVNIHGSLAFALAALFAGAASFLVLGIGNRLKVLDFPGPDRPHLKPVVRLGGLAILPAFMISLLVTVSDPGRFFGLAACAVAIAAVGFVDDICRLRPWLKLAGQTSVALAAFALGVRILGVSNPLGGVIELPVELAMTLTVFWLVGMMNAINLLDGLDGLAPGVVLVAALIFAILSAQLGSAQLALVGLALAGAIAGFLPFNAYHARLILGDSGSQLLGFLIGALAVLGQAKIGTALLVLGIPILDVAWTIIRRRLSGRGIMSRDTDHLHHRLLAAGLSRSQVTIVYVGLCAAFGVSGLLLDRFEKVIGLVALGAVTGTLLYVGARRASRGS